MSDAMAAQVLSGLIFFGFVYYVAWIPLRDKRKGIEQPHLIERVKRDVKILIEKVKASINLFKK